MTERKIASVDTSAPRHAAGDDCGSLSAPPQMLPVAATGRTESVPPPSDSSEDTLRECFVQSSETARAYMDLRFKHFGTFIVLIGLLGAAAFQLESLAGVRQSVAGVGLALTLLFWLLDFRTSQYLADELHRIRTFKRLLRVPATGCPRRTVLLRASHTTNLIFFVIAVTWVMILAHLWVSR